ncbi:MULTISPECIES: hypothetical protein [unclassified Bradyrhizobium]|uniref:hypothetical protein n=1 Tax=unclassified Bradyrhizobium TaxID=2631580 RepID=UPI0024787B3E|nr:MULTISPECIES: hypothetical protein [unclassified Bradyrhizobium]WGR73324.1 hypothetical protein MTX24_11125 [Bradyrhizobium sp. ISRA426]WGR78161.1 hypothetical protein MTX21_36095 [Bradyrhizobium sp. ISRA430]WGR88562.1 hypothetical protein MTX25_11135 [Bradyrhizobium sp. ISRA432]
MQSSKLLEPPSPKLLPTRQQFMCGRYALHLFIAQDWKATSLIHVNRSHRFGSVVGLRLPCIDVTKPFAEADHSIFLPTFRITKYGTGSIAAASQSFWWAFSSNDFSSMAPLRGLRMYRAKGEIDCNQCDSHSSAMSAVQQRRQTSDN